jgi:hypothetical protein
MKKFIIGMFALCLGLGMVSCGNKTAGGNTKDSTATAAAPVEETVKMEDVIAKAKAEGANWDEAQWKASYKDAMKAMKPMFDYMRDMEKKMKEVESGDDAAKAAAVAKIMTESEAKQKEFAPLEKQMDEYQAIINANPIGKKIDNDKAFQEELKKEFNLPEDM